jgi:hypothetical protein
LSTQAKNASHHRDGTKPQIKKNLSFSAAARSARDVPRISHCIAGLHRSEVACRHCLAQFLRRFTPLPTRLVHGSFRYRNINDMTPDDLTPFEDIHRMTPLVRKPAATENALPVLSGRAFQHLRAWQ